METLLITIIGGLIVGLILYYIFGIGKPKNKISNAKRVGILNLCKRNKFYDNTFSGLDVGIDDKGEDTKAERNQFS